MAAHKGPSRLRPRRTQGGSSVAAIPIYTLFWSFFNETLIFSMDFPEIRETKIRSVGAELFYAGGRADGRKCTTKLIVFFSVLRTRLKIPGQESLF
jgi:hypothetical protein